MSHSWQYSLFDEPGSQSSTEEQEGVLKFGDERKESGGAADSTHRTSNLEMEHSLSASQKKIEIKKEKQKASVAPSEIFQNSTQKDSMRAHHQSDDYTDYQTTTKEPNRVSQAYKNLGENSPHHTHRSQGNAYSHNSPFEMPHWVDTSSRASTIHSHSHSHGQTAYVTAALRALLTPAESHSLRKPTWLEEIVKQVQAESEPQESVDLDADWEAQNVSDQVHTWRNEILVNHEQEVKSGLYTPTPKQSHWSTLQKNQKHHAPNRADPLGYTGKPKNTMCASPAIATKILQNQIHVPGNKKLKLTKFEFQPTPLKSSLGRLYGKVEAKKDLTHTNHLNEPVHNSTQVQGSLRSRIEPTEIWHVARKTFDRYPEVRKRVTEREKQFKAQPSASNSHGHQREDGAYQSILNRYLVQENGMEWPEIDVLQQYDYNE